MSSNVEHEPPAGVRLEGVYLPWSEVVEGPPPPELVHAMQYLYDQGQKVKPIRGESEYVTRGLIDRRLSFLDQRLARVLLGITRARRRKPTDDPGSVLN